MIRGITWVGAAFLSAALVLVSHPSAMASHPDVTTLRADGIAAGASDAYSPKQTCGGCHFNCTDRSYSSNRSTWCDGATTTPLKWNCSTTGNCPDYESQEVKNVTKAQGFGTSTGTTKFENYVVKSPQHGASTGKHSTHGRNEEWTAALRSIWGAPGFTSSPGMSGRY
jgi:hypothetical protein